MKQLGALRTDYIDRSIGGAGIDDDDFVQVGDAGQRARDARCFIPTYDETADRRRGWSVLSFRSSA